MEYPEEVCQKRWTCLRDRYVKEKRQENFPSGSGANYTCQWPLIQTMEFIAPYVVPRPMRYSYSIFQENTQSPLSQHSPVYEPSPLSVFPSQPETSTSFFEPILTSSTTPAKAKRKRTIENDDDKHFGQAIKTFEKFCESKMEKPQKDALTGFGNMIVATIRTMSETNQLLAMQKVTSLVMELKLNN